MFTPEGICLLQCWLAPRVPEIPTDHTHTHTYFILRTSICNRCREGENFSWANQPAMTSVTHYCLVERGCSITGSCCALVIADTVDLAWFKVRVHFRSHRGRDKMERTSHMLFQPVVQISWPGTALKNTSGMTADSYTFSWKTENMHQFNTGCPIQSNTSRVVGKQIQYPSSQPASQVLHSYAHVWCNLNLHAGINHPSASHSNESASLIYRPGTITISFQWNVLYVSIVTW